MMKKFIALFRGINVGGRNILPMKELRKLLEDNAYYNVQSYIQSGNVIFECAKSPNNLNTLMEEKYNFSLDIIILDIECFLEIVVNNPYQFTEGKTVHFYFCKATPEPNIDKLDFLKAPSEEYNIQDNVLYLHAPDGIGRSKLAASLEKNLGVAATGRNLNTVNKLVNLLEQSKE